MSLFEAGVQNRRKLLVAGLGAAAAGTVGAASPAAAATVQQASDGHGKGHGHGHGHEHAKTNSSGIIHVPAGEAGVNVWLYGDTYSFKAHSENTNGVFALVEASITPGGGPDWHHHPDNDESFYLVHGSLKLSTRTKGKVEDLTVNAGDFIYIPRMTEHCFTNTRIQPATMIFTYSPAGPEWFIAALGEQAVPGESAPPRDDDKPNPQAGAWR